MTRPPRHHHGRRGFTLLDALATLAVGSAVIAGAAGLVRNIVFDFDHGTRAVERAERLSLAAERLAADFASARYVTPTGGTAVAFQGGPAGIAFIGAAEIASGPRGEEVVMLAVEEGPAETARLVRRRVGWPGPAARLEDLVPADPVVLLEGPFAIGFAYGSVGTRQALTWSESWRDMPELPRFVRVTVRDRRSGADLLAGAAFALRADAPIVCAEPDANAGCISVPVGTVAPPRSQQRGGR